MTEGEDDIKMDLREQVVGMDGVGSRSFIMAGFAISCIEIWGSTTTNLF
jgi:hypothetical protein